MNPCDETLKIFDEHAAHLLGAIRLCLKHEYIVPAMMLIFAGMDGMAWMYRTHEGQSTGNDFKQWVDKFMIGHLKSRMVDSADLWAARNALLHVQSSYSDSNVKGRARPILYINSKGPFLFPVKDAAESTDEPAAEPAARQPIILTAEPIVERFEIAIKDFRDYIGDNSERTDVILDRCGNWFNYGPPSGAA